MVARELMVGVEGIYSPWLAFPRLTLSFPSMGSRIGSRMEAAQAQRPKGASPGFWGSPQWQQKKEMGREVEVTRQKREKKTQVIQSLQTPPADMREAAAVVATRIT